MEIPPARWPATIGKEVRDLIRRMSIENPLWGAPKIHGELLKLGIDVAQKGSASIDSLGGISNKALSYRNDPSICDCSLFGNGVRICVPADG